MADAKLVTILTAKDMTEAAWRSATRHAERYAKALTAIVAISATGAAAAITKMAVDSAKAAKVQIDAEKKLEAVIRATGGAAGYTADEMKKMASGLQEVTNFGDETIISAQAILATFKDIGKEAFAPALEAAMDMSAVMGTDLKSSIVQIGKALNDPIKGLSALSRVGVIFTEQQKQQIKALQESGDLFGAQKIILQELQSEFGGTSRAMADIYVQTRNSYGDMLESIGTILREGLAPTVAKLKEWIEANNDLIKQNLPEYIEKVQHWAALAADAFASAGESVGNVLNAYQKAPPLVVEAGIFGALMFGKKGMALAAAGLFMTDAFEELDKLVKLYASEDQSGKRFPIPPMPSDYVTGGTLDDLPEKFEAATKSVQETRLEIEKFGKASDKSLKAARREIDKFEKETARNIDNIIRNIDKYTDSWQVAGEMAGYTQSELIEAQKVIDEITRRQTEAMIEQIRTSGTFFDGMKLGWKQITEAQIQWGREGERIMLEYKRMFDYTLGESLFHAVKGEWDDMRDVWKQLLDDMLRMLTNTVARMIAQWALLKIGGAFGIEIGGGGGFNIPIGAIGSGASGFGSGAGAAAGAGGAAAIGSSWAGAGAAPAIHGGGSAGIGAAGIGAGAAYAGAAAIAAVAITGIIKGWVSHFKNKGESVHKDLDDLRMQYDQNSEEYRYITQRIRDIVPSATHANLNIDEFDAGIDSRQKALENMDQFLMNAASRDYSLLDAQMGRLGFDKVMGGLENLIGVQGGEEITIDVVTALVDNATVDLEKKFEALGFVGSNYGWESPAVISMAAELVDDGVPWQQIEKTLAGYGVEDTTVIKEIVGNYIDDGMNLDELKYMMEETGLPARVLKEISATIDPIEAHARSFNYFKMDYSGPTSLSLNLEGRQHGGPVRANTPYIVGEAGPELFVPSSSGNIRPNASSTAGGNRPINVIVKVADEEFGAYVANIADGEIVRAERLKAAGNPATRMI
ncbi:MAG: hypothetical protein DRP56_02850 [Planctomycetota bacterium]|nr:MAG: hypothetical protein DRP56_02850 [Planctomycetota bacterium]